MHYAQFFRQLREARGLSFEALAKRAGCHRNTVINVEARRPVRFATLADLMVRMDYPPESDEMRALALLWLEAVSGIPFSRPATAKAARRQVAAYERGAQLATRQLADAVSAAGLTVEQIHALGFAARHPEVVSIVESIRDLVEAGTADETVPSLKVAEEK